VNNPKVKHLGINKLVGTIIFMMLFSLFLFYRCIYHLLYHPLPNLHKSKWVFISVEYTVFGNSKEEKHKWSTNDSKILDKLQKVFKVYGGGDLWGIGMMTTNKIYIECANGEKWIMYITDPDEVSVCRFSNPVTGFGMNISSDFYNTLKSIIQATEDKPIFFWHSSESNSSNNREKGTFEK